MTGQESLENKDQHTELIPQEPGWKSPSYRGWELLSIPGLISTYYDIDLDGQLDYAVIRKIIKKMESAKVSIKEAIKIRILALEGVATLEFAVEQFRNQTGHPPSNLEDLVDHGVLNALPENPYGRPYAYREGRIEF